MEIALIEFNKTNQNKLYCIIKYDKIYTFFTIEEMSAFFNKHKKVIFVSLFKDIEYDLFIDILASDRSSSQKEDYILNNLDNEAIEYNFNRCISACKILYGSKQMKLSRLINLLRINSNSSKFLVLRSLEKAIVDSLLFRKDLSRFNIDALNYSMTEITLSLVQKYKQDKSVTINTNQDILNPIVTIDNRNKSHYNEFLTSSLNSSNKYKYFIRNTELSYSHKSGLRGSTSGLFKSSSKIQLIQIDIKSYFSEILIGKAMSQVIPEIDFIDFLKNLTDLRSGPFKPFYKHISVKLTGMLNSDHYPISDKNAFNTMIALAVNDMINVIEKLKPIQSVQIIHCCVDGLIISIDKKDIKLFDYIDFGYKVEKQKDIECLLIKDVNNYCYVNSLGNFTGLGMFNNNVDKTISLNGIHTCYAINKGVQAYMNNESVLDCLKKLDAIDFIMTDQENRWFASNRNKQEEVSFINEIKDIDYDFYVKKVNSFFNEEINKQNVLSLF